MAKLDGKKINVFTDDKFRVTTLRCPYRENGIVKFRDKDFRYSLYLDCNFNMYLIPAKAVVDPSTGKSVINPITGKADYVDAYTVEDIIKAALGDKSALDLMEYCRSQIKAEYGKDVMAEKNINTLYQVNGRVSMLNSYNGVMREAGFAEVSEDDFPKTVKTAENFTPEELDFIIKHADEI